MNKIFFFFHLRWKLKTFFKLCFFSVRVVFIQITVFLAPGIRKFLLILRTIFTCYIYVIFLRIQTGRQTKENIEIRSVSLTPTGILYHIVFDRIINFVEELVNNMTHFLWKKKMMIICIWYVRLTNLFVKINFTVWVSI